MHGSRRLTDTELSAARLNRAAGEASLACEGMALTAEEKALFDSFERDRIPHDERRQRLMQFSREKRRQKASALV